MAADRKGKHHRRAATSRSSLLSGNFFRFPPCPSLLSSCFLFQSRDPPGRTRLRLFEGGRSGPPLPPTPTPSLLLALCTTALPLCASASASSSPTAGSQAGSTLSPLLSPLSPPTKIAKTEKIKKGEKNSKDEEEEEEEDDDDDDDDVHPRFHADSLCFNNLPSRVPDPTCSPVCAASRVANRAPTLESPFRRAGTPQRGREERPPHEPADPESRGTHGFKEQAVSGP